MQKYEPHYYIYTLSFTDEEQELCELEMRALFGMQPTTNLLTTTRKINPSRSPFINERLGVLVTASSFHHLLEQLPVFKFEESFKVTFIQNRSMKKTPYKERREIEKRAGLLIKGRVHLQQPDLLLAVMQVPEGWVFGIYHKAEPIWHRHQDKPHHYSTALSTRVARALVNIAVPNPQGIKAIDPCCGIGTVLIEALSMGIDIVGSDINPLVLQQTRENIAHFDFNTEVTKLDIREVTGKYDVAIIDMPYNLCSVLSDTEKLEMLQSARNFSKTAVFVTIEQLNHVIEKAGFKVVDRCVVKKGKTFLREIIMCN
ncbi:TRM11 family SAM-dependent methyltransferase [Bacillus alkalicellulosilyticus]|uniref:TRM11 family SAM-dependent methyltransferase n=1 Tax=Alkalihalobacterium alkalicellulosilyticum TaxID=1912214 RepID=UPI0031836F9B